MRAIVILGGLAAAVLVVALWLGDSDIRPTGAEVPPGTGSSVQTPSGPVSSSPGTHGDEVIRTDPVPAANAQLRGRFWLREEPTQLLAVVDGEHEVVIDQATGMFESPKLVAGEHYLLGVAVTGSFIDVFEARPLLAAGEQLNLGDLVPRMSEWGRLHIQSVHPASGRRFDLAEVARSGLSRRRADLLVGGLKIFVPIAKEMALRGLPDDGLSVGVVGAPPTVRLRSKTLYLRRDFDTKRVRPTSSVTLTLEYAPRVPLKVFVNLPPQPQAVDLDVRLQLIDLDSGIEVTGECESYRADDRLGLNTAQGRLIGEAGTHLLLARAIRNEVAEVAFGAQVVTLEPLGNQTTLHTAPVWPARGHVSGGQPGDVIEIGLAAAPDTPLWLAKVGAEGQFRVQGLPADHGLVMSVAGAQPQVLRAEVRDGRLELTPVPR